MVMDVSAGRLQQLVAVARCGSFSRAAAELNISQPALSRSIAAIEERYGFQIFNRLGHGVELTAAGAQAVEQARPLLQGLRVFDNNLKLFGSGKAGSLSIGMTPLLASEILARFSGDFFAPGNKAELRVTIRTGAALLDDLDSNLIELFFYPDGQIAPTTEIEIESVGRLVPACVVRAAHPLAARDDLTLADLGAYPWASSVDPPLPGGVLSEARFLCDNYHIIREAVLETDLICICSQAFVARELASGALRQLRIEGLSMPDTSIDMARLRGRVHSPLATRAIDRIRQMLAHDASPGTTTGR